MSGVTRGEQEPVHLVGNDVQWATLSWRNTRNTRSEGFLKGLTESLIYARVHEYIKTCIVLGKRFTREKSGEYRVWQHARQALTLWSVAYDHQSHSRVVGKDCEIVHPFFVRESSHISDHDSSISVPESAQLLTSLRRRKQSPINSSPP